MHPTLASDRKQSNHNNTQHISPNQQKTTPIQTHKSKPIKSPILAVTNTHKFQFQHQIQIQKFVSNNLEAAHRNLLDVIVVEARHLSIVAVNEEEPPHAVLPQVVRQAQQRNRGEARLERRDCHLEARYLVHLAPAAAAAAIGALAQIQRHQRQRHANRRENAPRHGKAQNRTLVEAKQLQKRFQTRQRSIQFTLLIIIVIIIVIVIIILLWLRLVVLI